MSFCFSKKNLLKIYLKYFWKKNLKKKSLTWPILTLSAAWKCSSVTKSRIISHFLKFSLIFCFFFSKSRLFTGFFVWVKNRWPLPLRRNFSHATRMKREKSIFFRKIIKNIIFVKNKRNKKRIKKWASERLKEEF